MKRITTMHFDVTSKRSKDCKDDCLFISHLHDGHVKSVKKDNLHERYAKEYTQLAFMINSYQARSLPEEIRQSIETFHKGLEDISLEEDREKTIRLLKFFIVELNKTVKDWNHSHLDEQPIRLNLTVTFIYGDHLILLNFGNNIVYMYRDGDLAGFKGSRLENETHYSLKTGREGKTEYLLFEKMIPPIGEVQFDTSQITVLFKLTHRLLKGDILSVLAEDSINVDRFRVDVNLFENAIERPQLIRLIKQSVHPDSESYAWYVLTFDEVRELRQTVRYTLFRTAKGLFSIGILLASLIAPIIFNALVEVDTTPVQAFDRPPTTSSIIITDSPNDVLIDLIPSISGTPESLSKLGVSEIEIQNVSKRLGLLIDSNQYNGLSAYYPVKLDENLATELSKTENKAIYLSNKMYASDVYSTLISRLNPTHEVNWTTGQFIYLPVFSSPYEPGQTLEDISVEFYGSSGHWNYLKTVNSLDIKYIPYMKTILVPPLEYFLNN